MICCALYAVSVPYAIYFKHNLISFSKNIITKCSVPFSYNKSVSLIPIPFYLHQFSFSNLSIFLGCYTHTPTHTHTHPKLYHHKYQCRRCRKPIVNTNRVVTPIGQPFTGTTREVASTYSAI